MDISSTLLIMNQRYVKFVGFAEEEEVRRGTRSYFQDGQACYIMDAKSQGNIGRYLNVSKILNTTILFKKQFQCLLPFDWMLMIHVVRLQ